MNFYDEIKQIEKKLAEVVEQTANGPGGILMIMLALTRFAGRQVETMMTNPPKLGDPVFQLEQWKKFAKAIRTLTGRDFVQLLRIERPDSRSLMRGQGSLSTKLSGPDRVTLNALFDIDEEKSVLHLNRCDSFDARELLQSADIIIGVDIDSGKEYPILGRKLLQQIAQTGEPANASILRVEVDAHSEHPGCDDELDALVTIVQSATGIVEFDEDDEFDAA